MSVIGNELFTTATATRIYEQGQREEKQRLLGPPRSEADSETNHVKFTVAAYADWLFLDAAYHPGASMQLSEILSEGLDILRSGRFSIRDLTEVGCKVYLLKQRGLRWVFRHGQKTIVVYGIGQSRLNPFRKIWRYFDETKAVDLLNKNELYLSRVDCLADKFEARPTTDMVKALTSALTGALGQASPDHLKLYDNIRRALFVCCWQKAEHESLEMWKGYCLEENGGFALQSTERQLQHQFVRMCQGRRFLYFRDITYVDHNSYDPKWHGVPEQAFLKKTEFTHENEIRFAWWHPEVLCGKQADIEVQLAKMPTFNRLPFDLEAATERLVFNPVASETDKVALLAIIRAKHPSLESRIARSEFFVRRRRSTGIRRTVVHQR